MGSLLAKFRWRKTEYKPASEQEAAGVDGTRRDIPEREYEREYPQSQTEHSGDAEKASESQAPTVESSPVEKQAAPTAHPIETKEEVKLVDSEKKSSQQETPIAHPIETKEEVELVDTEKKSPQQETVPVSKAESIDVSLKEEQIILPSVQQNEEASKQVTVDVTDSKVHEKVQDENDNANVEEAVVKIQAGIRGYLTRKTLKEQRDGEAARKSPLPEDKPDKEVEKQVEEAEIHAMEAPEAQIKEAEIHAVKDEQHEEKAAVKIQALYRGYRTRKTLNDSGNEVIEEPEQSDISTDGQQSSEARLDSTESKIISDESLVSEEGITEDQNENDDDALQQAAVKIQSTFRGYQVRKQMQEVSREEENQLPACPSDNKEELNVTSPVENGEGKTEDKAAIKIQAVYRGYKVRKEMQSDGTNAESQAEELSKTESAADSRVSQDVTEEEEEEEEEEETEEVDEEEEVEEEEEEEDEHGTVQSKASITLSPSAKHDILGERNEKAISIDSSRDQMIPSAPVLDNNVKEHCEEKPSASESVEPKLSKSVSEPAVELNAASKIEESSLCSPSSD